MDIHVETRDGSTGRLRDLIAARMRYALRRLAWLVSAVRVRLSRMPAAAPADKRCEILMVSSGHAVRVASFAPTWPQALELALGRARGTALRLSRQRAQRRLPYRPRPLLTRRG